MKQKLPLYTLLLLITLSSCSKKTAPENATYFGGEIINPHSKYVVLYKDNQLIDSISLDENHKFKYKFKDFKKGLYTFSHDEYQYIYLEPNDSLFLRLNTVEFDETLTFSGKGADKNNFLIKTFLKNESEIEQAHALYKLPPKKFMQITNDQLKQKHIALERYADKYLFSEDFKAIANAHIDYQIYGVKERYATVNRTNDSVHLPQSYFDYRKKVDFNAENLIDFYPYSNYLNTFIRNIAHTNHSCKNPLDTYITKLNVIDSIISNPKIKNNLFEKIGYSYFNKKDSPKNRKAFLTAFRNHTHNQELIAYITKLSHKVTHLNKGTALPNFNVIAPNTKKVAIQNLITKPTVLYFWTENQPRHFKSVHKKVKQYTQNSEYQFIGICIDGNTEQWKKIIKNFKFNNEYLIANPTDISQKLILPSLQKTFVVNQNGTILSANLNLFDVQFIEKLKQL